MNTRYVGAGLGGNATKPKDYAREERVGREAVTFIPELIIPRHERIFSSPKLDNSSEDREYRVSAA